MKPVGLVDPRTGRRPYAVVQLRQDNLAASHCSIVGFQTQLKWGEQKRVFRMIPGLERAEFVRFGMIHRNTYVNAPRTLEPTFETRRRPGPLLRRADVGRRGLRRVGRVGAARRASAPACRARGGEPARLPRGHGARARSGRYIARSDPAHYQPTNIAFGLLPELPRARARQGEEAAGARRSAPSRASTRFARLGLEAAARRRRAASSG